MKRYRVTIVETLARDYWVDAANEDDAERFIEGKYRDGDIVLDVVDYFDDKIEVERDDYCKTDFVLDENGEEVKKEVKDEQ